jgi:hypothetical protein
MGHIEGAIQVDLNDLLPLLGTHLVHGGRKTRHARVVDEHVEAAQRLSAESHHPLDVIAPGDVANFSGEAGNFSCACLERLLVDVTDENLGAMARKGARDLASDP